MAHARMGPARGELSLPQEASRLGWLIHPIRKSDFFRDYWEQAPLVVKRDERKYFCSLLSLDEIDRVITTTDIRYPNLTLKNADRAVTAEDYTRDGDALDVAKVYQLYEQGATITLAYLDTAIPELTSLCRALESEFSFPFQANVYLTPAGAKGAKHHFDSHDVFVLQIEGTKHWTCYGTPVELPLREQDFDPAVHERGEASLEFELEPGDLAYIPRGVVHDARSGDNVSLHITLGILTSTWADFLREAIAECALSDAALRKALPPGFASQGFDRRMAEETFRGLLARICENANFGRVLDHFKDEFLSACPPILRGQLGELGKLNALRLDTQVGPRSGVLWLLGERDGKTEIDCYGRRITFPVHAGEAVHYAMTHGEFAVRELPGALDDAGKLALVRRLIREGLLGTKT